MKKFEKYLYMGGSEPLRVLKFFLHKKNLKDLVVEEEEEEEDGVGGQVEVDQSQN